MRQKRKGRSGHDSLEGVSAKGAAATPAACPLPRMPGSNRRAEMERLMTFDQEAEIRRLLNDLTTILLETEMTDHPEDQMSVETDPLSSVEFLRKRRRCGEA